MQAHVKMSDYCNWLKKIFHVCEGDIIFTKEIFVTIEERTFGLFNRSYVHNKEINGILNVCKCDTCGKLFAITDTINDRFNVNIEYIKRKYEKELEVENDKTNYK